MTRVRLHVFLARAGVASRRACEELIRSGHVTVNGELVTRLGTRVDPEADHVKCRGRLIRGGNPRRHVLLNKPRGVVSTASDPEGRPTVVDLVPGRGSRLYPVGRLDLQSEGLILLTNDGELAEALIHPRSGVPRTYHAKIRGRLDARARERLGRGLRLEGRQTRPLRVRTLKVTDGASWIEVTVTEGRRHLVRDALASVGHPVVRLRRVALGPLRLGDLAPGAFRPLDERELSALRRLARGAGGGRQAGRPVARRSGGRRPRADG